MLDLRTVGEANLQIPPERAPKEGTFAGFATFKNPPQAGTYTVSLSAGGWVEVLQNGHALKPKAFSGATDCDGIRKTMKYEIGASPFVLQISGAKFRFVCDPAVRLRVRICLLLARNRPEPAS
jgi:hypothetical protein